MEKEDIIEEKLRTRIKEMYEETTCTVEVNDEEVGRFRTENGVRQVCPISPSSFNLSMSDLRKELGKVQEGGIMLGKKKIYSLAYADDVVLLANNKSGMKEMMKR